MKRYSFTPAWLTPFCVVGVVLLGAIHYSVRSNLDTIRSHQLAVTHTMAVQQNVERIRGSLLAAESAVRGYVITHDAGLVEMYRAAGGRIPEELQQLNDVTLDNARQSSRLGSLRTLLEGRLHLLEQVVREETLHPERDAVAMVEEGAATTSKINGLLNAMAEEEQSRLEQRTASARASTRSTEISFDAGTLVVLISFLALYALLRRQLTAQRRESFFASQLSSLNYQMASATGAEEYGRRFLESLSELRQIERAAFYVARDGALELAAGLALDPQAPRRLEAGQTLVGEAARVNRVLVVDKAIPASADVTASQTRVRAVSLVVLPVTYEQTTLGVFEISSTNAFVPAELELLESFRASLGVRLQNVISQSEQQRLLKATQVQAEELLVQQEELQQQQEELRQTNEELEQQARVLEEHQQLAVTRNQELELTKSELEENARKLTAANQYKSQFLANMSHELRTPLNSLLILASLLMENRSGRLADNEVEFARTIYNSGNDLLTLINEILDLAKVESGAVRLEIEPVSPAALLESLDRAYRPVAESKSLRFLVESTLDPSQVVATDRLRVEQILRNFLSNSLKFTQTGEIRLEARRAPTGQLSLSVSDTGIGIPADKLDHIFEAFQQADGSTSRKYGGTGLGLTISRELAHLLGGRIEVESQPGRGSTFRLWLPLEGPVQVEETRPADPSPAAGPSPAAPLPAAMEAGPYVLIVEDDETFARTLGTLARESGFSSYVAGDGEAALLAVEQRLPLAILLDVKLPTISGLAVLEKLKSNSRTRHIPVHVISGIDNSANALRLGAMGYLVKPASREQIEDVLQRVSALSNRKEKRLLIIEDDPVQRESLVHLIRTEDVQPEAVGTGAEALERLAAGSYDCAILDLKLPDMTGFELLQRLQSLPGPLPPVVVYTGKDLSRKETEELRRYSESIILKGARSPERLLEEVSLFLHQVEAELPADRRDLLHKVRNQPGSFTGRSILVADDDMRNTFALMSALEPEGFQITVARNGKEALQALESDPGIELVLMDIMMPEMDGLEAIRCIRADASRRSLPIIALTAKAMKEDQERCIEVGANDYLAKPFKLDHLFSLLRVWLPHETFGAN